jgi:hypothetical protein
MSKIMQSLSRCARHSRKPKEDRKRYEFTGMSLLAFTVAGQTVRAYLNGEFIDACLIADEIAGYVEVYAEPLRFDPDAGQFVRIKKRGVVGVEIEGTQ